MEQRTLRVAVIYNHVGPDEYAEMRKVDPATLGFKPEYAIHVATVEEEIDAVAKALRNEGCEAVPFNIAESLERLDRFLIDERPDVIFNLVEYIHDDPKLEAAVAGLFDLHRIPYTGSPPFALMLCQRKGLTKQLLLANGVRTPRFRLLFTPRLPRRHGLHYPIIVKPAREDASSGVEKASVVYDLQQLFERIEKGFAEFAPPILVEEFIEGRELHVSVVGNDPPRVFPIQEFDFSELPEDYPSIISYDAKWNPLVEEYHRLHSICPAKLTKSVERRVIESALHAYQITNCRDYARVDIRLSKENKPYVLEVNPNPDLTEGVSFMECAEKGGVTFSQTLRMIVEFAWARAPTKH
jgi:D-alanine-D-alanine ligase